MVRKHLVKTSRKSIKKPSLKTVPVSKSSSKVKSKAPSSKKKKPSSDNFNNFTSESGLSSDILNKAEGIKLKKTLATAILLLLIGFVLYALYPFLNAFLGAVLVYFLFRPLDKYFRNKGMSKALAASLVLVIILLVITLPLYFGAKLLITEVSSMSFDDQMINNAVGFFQDLVPSIDLVSLIKEQMVSFGTFAKNLAVSAISNVGSLIINWILFFFVTFYLFYNTEGISKNSKYLLPFSEKNRLIIFEEFKKITNSTVIATGAIGVLQGFFMGLAFYIFGISNPVLWGFLSMIFAMLPVIGITFIWIPAAAFLAFVDQNYAMAIGLSVWGFIVTNVDYVLLRPWIQRRMGKLHPLTTLVGIFMGIPIFGLFGLIIGPLLLSFVILLTKMYLEEHLNFS